MVNKQQILLFLKILSNLSCLIYIAEILLKVALSTFKQTNKQTNKQTKHTKIYEHLLDEMTNLDYIND